ncbi:MAG: porin [Rhodoferax sp.]|nr:porin [Rhodoferax sp.]
MLKKSVVAVAVATVAMGVQAGELATDKDVKFEVNVDVGAYYVGQNDKAGRQVNEIKGKGLNQVEIKATKTINADVSIFGEIEVDYDPVVDNATFLSDDTRIGIASKQLGRFSAGQFDGFFEDNVMEVLGTGHGENGYVSEPASSNDGRHLQYSHKVGDLSFAVDYTSAMGPTATNSENSNGFAVGVSYKVGGLTLAGGWSELAKYKADSSKTTGELNTDRYATGLAATYQMGSVGIRGLVAEVESITKVKTSYTGVALTYVMGEFDFGLSLQKVKPENANGRDEWSAGVGYTPFKNMQFYLDFAGLNKANGDGDVAELGLKYSF